MPPYLVCYIWQNFNPRTREGCDLAEEASITGDGYISIHAPVKGATQSNGRGIAHGKYFNPRTREGCDGCQDGPRQRRQMISIHAPVKGATSAFMAHAESIFKFQSTHP